MKVSVSDAKAQLTELVRRAESGDEVILTRHGHAAVRLVPVRTVPDRTSRRRVLEAVRAAAAAKASGGADAARSQDFSTVTTAFLDDCGPYFCVDGDPAR